MIIILSFYPHPLKKKFDSLTTEFDEENYTNGVKVVKSNGYTPANSVVLSYEPDLTKNAISSRNTEGTNDYNYNEKPRPNVLNGILKNRDAERLVAMDCI